VAEELPGSLSGHQGHLTERLLDPATYASCSDRGAWRQVEALLRRHSGIVASGSTWTSRNGRSTC